MIGRKSRYVFIKALAAAYMLLAPGFKVCAQTANNSQLLLAIKKSHADTSRVNLLLKLSNYYVANVKPPIRAADSAMVYAEAAGKLATALAYPKGSGNSYMAMAKAYVLKKDSAGCNSSIRKAVIILLNNQCYREAAEAYLKGEEYYQALGGTDMNVRIAWYEKALAQFKKTTAYARQEATLKILGDFYQVQGNYPKSLQRLEEALPLIRYVELIDKESLYDLLGSVNVMMGNLNKGLEYGLLAIKTAEQGKDTSMQLCAVYNRVGITYYQMRQLQPAKLYYEKSLAIAARYHDASTEIGEYVNIAHVLISMGKFDDCLALLKKVTHTYTTEQLSDQLDHNFLKCLIRLKRYKEAKFYADRMEAASLKADQNDNDQQITQSLLTEYYVATGQGKAAHKHLAHLKRISKAQNNPFAMAIAYTLEGRLDSIEKRFDSAYINYGLAANLKDMVWNTNQGRQVAQLQIQFETEKKNQELKAKEDHIKLLNNQARLQRINLQQEKTTQKLIIAGAILLVILLALSFNGYRLKQRVNKQLQAQQVEIEQKNSALTELVQQKDNLLGEKEWLMKEIHHRVKNNLQIVISLLSTQSKYLDNDVAYKAIRESQHRMQSISLIHQKLYQSDNLALVDINAYIADLVEYLRDSFDTGTRIEFELEVISAEFDVTRAVPLGLILNEAITNAIKYAFPGGRSGKVFIGLQPADDSTFLLQIRDNGVGLPPEANVGKGRSLGMSLMRGLSKQLGGSLNIDGSNGITIEVHFINETLLQAI